ncbi:MAG: type II toxin-antitoxin system VapC family toxin [Vicinamibacteria bacterium]
MLVDTSAFVGLFFRDDEWHVPAVRTMKQLGRDRKRLLTTTDIFDETITALRVWSGHANAVKAGEVLKSSRLVRVVHVGARLREAAWRLFKKYDDHVFSFTDCTSFATMEQFGVQSAFSFDGDFEEAGYSTIPS